MPKRLVAIAVLMLLSMLSIIHTVAYAQSPQISLGIAWLYSAQTASGNWPQVETSDYYSTAETLSIVSTLGPSSSAYSLGFLWLSSQLVSPTDYLSRQIIARSRAGLDASTELSSLLLYRNSAGGFVSADHSCPK